MPASTARASRRLVLGGAAATGAAVTLAAPAAAATSYTPAHYRGDRYDFVMELHGEAGR